MRDRCGPQLHVIGALLLHAVRGFLARGCVIYRLVAPHHHLTIGPWQARRLPPVEPAPAPDATVVDIEGDGSDVSDATLMTEFFSGVRWWCRLIF